MLTMASDCAAAPRRERNVSLLVVEDHPTMRESLRYIFELSGATHVTEATTCGEALRAVREQTFGVVLLDLALPDGNGLDLLEQLHELCASLPVVIHSFHYNRELLHRSFRRGAVGFSVKGGDKYALITSVARAANGENAWTAEQLARIDEVERGHASTLAQSGSPS